MTCDHCGESFATLTATRLHQEDCDHEPDFDDPFAPDLDSDREVVCLHCTAEFLEKEVVYEKRFGTFLWRCPTDGCDGRGVGFDIVDRSRI